MKKKDWKKDSIIYCTCYITFSDVWEINQTRFPLDDSHCCTVKSSILEVDKQGGGGVVQRGVWPPTPSTPLTPIPVSLSSDVITPVE